MRLRLIGRPGCHLCEELLEALLTEFPREAWRIEQADVDSNVDWQRRYGLKIPVLLDEDGSVVCSTFFDAEAVGDWLAQQNRRSAPPA